MGVKRRLAILIFLLLYLGTSVGFAMDLHFCGTRLAVVQINASVKKACCKQEKKKAVNKCCKNKRVEVKVSEQSKTVSLSKVPSAAGFDLFLLPVSELRITALPVTQLAIFSYRGPPQVSSIPLVIKNCVFRI